MGRPTVDGLVLCAHVTNPEKWQKNQLDTEEDEAIHAWHIPKCSLANFCQFLIFAVEGAVWKGSTHFTGTSVRWSHSGKCQVSWANIERRDLIARCFRLALYWPHSRPKSLGLFTGIRGKSLTRLVTTGIDWYRSRYLMFYAQSTAKGHIRANQYILLPQVKFRFTVSDTLIGEGETEKVRNLWYTCA